jgi:tetratricopeptide (TPR) repeat protein
LTLLGVAGMIGLVALWGWHTTRPNYRLNLARQVLGDAYVVSNGLGNWLADGFAYAWHRPKDTRARAERLASLLEASGNPCHAHLLRAEIRMKEGKYDEALAAVNAMSRFEAQLAQGPDLRLEGAVLSGRCLVFLHSHREAERVLRYAVDNWPATMDPARGLTDAHRGLFAVYYDQGAMTPAIDHLEEVSRLDPDDGRPHRALGRIYFDLNQPEKAIVSYTEALRRTLAPRVEGEVKIELAEVLIRAGQYEQIRHTLDGVAQNAKVMALEAEALWLASPSQIESARRLCDEALAKDPSCPQVLRLAARMNWDAGEVANTAPLLERLLKQDPHDAASRHLLAQVYRRLGRPKEAAEQQRLRERSAAYLTELTDLNAKALADPWDFAVRERLAVVCDQLDRPALAQMWRRAAQACGGRSPQVK